MREKSRLSSKSKLRLLEFSAVYSRTGILTRPKSMLPFQIARGGRHFDREVLRLAFDLRGILASAVKTAVFCFLSCSSRRCALELSRRDREIRAAVMHRISFFFYPAVFAPYLETVSVTVV